MYSPMGGQYKPKNFELGECDPDLFEAAKNSRVPESRLELGRHSVYLWMSSTGDNSFIYPSHVLGRRIDEATGLPDVSFTILNPEHDSIRDVHAIFLNGHFMWLKNNLPFYKYEPEGQVEITEGYFTTPAGIDLAMAEIGPEPDEIQVVKAPQLEVPQLAVPAPALAEVA